MTNPKHTPEPWAIRIRESCLWIENLHTIIFHVGEDEGWDQAQSDARRIVACVNACQGITTEELEKIVSEDCNVEDHYRAEQSEADFLDSKDAE